MEPITPTIPTPTTTSNGNNFKATSIKKLPIKFIIIGIGIGLLGLLALFFFRSNNPSTKQAQPWNDNPRFAPTVQLATVGQEPIYGNDLNYVLYTNYPNNTFTDQQAKEAALKSVATTSAILQAAKAQNITSIPDSLLTQNKDQQTRTKLSNEIREQISTRSTKYSASAISIWYYNTTPPKISESQARQIARVKIAKLLSDLRTNKITIEQAGNQIKNDKSLAQLDSNYKGNAYASFSNWTMDDPPFSFSVMNRALLSMQPKQYSDIIEIEISTGMTEKLFTILYLDSIQVGQFDSLSSWVKSASQQYPLQINQVQ